VTETDPNADLTAEFMDLLREMDPVEDARRAEELARMFQEEGLAEAYPEFFARLSARAKRIEPAPAPRAGSAICGEKPWTAAALH
jgi:hypothetical protein